MSRYLGVGLLCAAISALVGAQDSRPRLSPTEQAHLLARNRALVSAAVENSLDLTDKADALSRAGTCNKLVKICAGQVEEAARGNDSARAAEMGGHLTRLVKDGVAGNLRIARQKIRPESPMERELFNQRDTALDALKALQTALQSRRDLDPLLTDLDESRRSIESATK